MLGSKGSSSWRKRGRTTHTLRKRRERGNVMLTSRGENATGWLFSITQRGGEEGFTTPDFSRAKREKGTLLSQPLSWKKKSRKGGNTTTRRLKKRKRSSYHLKKDGGDSLHVFRQLVGLTGISGRIALILFDRREEKKGRYLGEEEKGGGEFSSSSTIKISGGMEGKREHHYGVVGRRGRRGGGKSTLREKKEEKTPPPSRKESCPESAALDSLHEEEKEEGADDQLLLGRGGQRTRFPHCVKKGLGSSVYSSPVEE